MMKKTPGPLAPPDSSRPSLKMTALSYSWTTFTTKKREKGSDARMMRREMMVMRVAQTPAPSSHTEQQSSVWTLL